MVPDPEEKLRQRCAIYSRVSTYKQKDDLDRQEDRLKTLATQRGYEIAESVKEIGSGVNDRRAKLVRLLNTPTWGTLIIEHRVAYPEWGLVGLRPSYLFWERRL